MAEHASRWQWKKLYFDHGDAGHFFKISMWLLYDHSIMNLEKLKCGMVYALKLNACSTV
jgi:hypothetical protein